MPTLGPGSQIYLKRTIEDLQPVVRTSKPYPLEKLDAVSLVTPMIVGGKLRVEPNDLGEINLISPAIVSGAFRAIKVFNTIPTEGIDILSPQISSGVFKSILIQIEADIDDTGVPKGVSIISPHIVSAKHSRIVIKYVMETEELQLSNPSLVRGSHG